MTAPASAPDLQRLIERVDAIRGRIEFDIEAAGIAGDFYESCQARAAAAKDALTTLAAEEGARVSRNREPMTMRLGGVSASATGGAAALLSNWRNAACRKLGRAA